jgi:hypothetical protein
LVDVLSLVESTGDLWVNCHRLMLLDSFFVNKLNGSCLMASLDRDLITELEKMGEADVRARLSRGEFGLLGSSKSRAVNAWLNNKESERKAARETKALSMSEEALLIARRADKAASAAVSQSGEAMSVGRLAVTASHRANVIAIFAMICSFLAVIAAAVMAIYR